MSTTKGHVLGITNTNGANLSSSQEEGKKKRFVPYSIYRNDNASNNNVISMECFAYLMVVKGAGRWSCGCASCGVVSRIRRYSLLKTAWARIRRCILLKTAWARIRLWGIERRGTINGRRERKSLWSISLPSSDLLMKRKQVEINDTSLTK